MKKFLKHLAYYGTLAIIVYLTILGIDSYKHATAESRLFMNTGEVTYMVLRPDGVFSGGTGFQVKTKSGKDAILTNRHVCELAQEEKLLVRNIHREDLVKVIQANAEEADLCLLEAPVRLYGKPLKLADAANYGEKVFLVGHPLLNPMTLKTGFLVGVTALEINNCHNVEEYLADAAGCIRTMTAQIATLDSRGGNSGSAVTNVDGEVVGVLFAGNDNGISALVPLEGIRKFLDRF